MRTPNAYPELGGAGGGGGATASSVVAVGATAADAPLVGPPSAPGFASSRDGTAARGDSDSYDAATSLSRSSSATGWARHSKGILGFLTILVSHSADDILLPSLPQADRHCLHCVARAEQATGCVSASRGPSGRGPRSGPGARQHHRRRVGAGRVAYLLQPRWPPVGGRVAEREEEVRRTNNRRRGRTSQTSNRHSTPSGIIAPGMHGSAACRYSSHNAPRARVGRGLSGLIERHISREQRSNSSAQPDHPQDRRSREGRC